MPNLWIAQSVHKWIEEDARVVDHITDLGDYRIIVVADVNEEDYDVE